jgi:hypothetical protein
MKTTLLGNLMRGVTLPGVSLAMRAFLICFLLSIAQAVTPPPSGGYPGRNTAAGTNALLRLTNGTDNTALGAGALQNNTEGQSNTAAGTGALDGNRRGNQNTGTGVLVLESSRFDNGPDNTAYGYRALGNNEGSRNTAIGWNALVIIFEGTDNIALGHSAGRNLSSSDSFNIDIGNRGVQGESNTIRIGDADQTKTFIAGVSGVGVTGAPVVVNAAGKLGTAPSSQRFKDEIKPIGKASEAIFALKPVTFRYKKELDPKGTQQFGLVAEEVEKVDRDLVVRDSDGKPYTVRYDAVNAMLLNEFLKEHRKVEVLESGVAQLTARFKEEDSRIQKVSEQLE